jgi:hypothetical protein
MLLGCASTRSSSGPWQQFTAPQGIAFSGPSDLKSEPAIGDDGLLAAYRCPRYYIAVSWASYEIAPVGDTTWSQVPRREVELGEGFGKPWPCGAALHIKWLRPGATGPERSNTLPARQSDSIPIFRIDGDFRVLHVSAGCKTLRDRDELMKIFDSVRFNPW